MEQLLELTTPDFTSRTGEKIGINGWVLDLMLRVLIEKRPDKSGMYYINSIYSMFIDMNKLIEHELRTPKNFSLIADYLNLLLERYGKHQEK